MRFTLIVVIKTSDGLIVIVWRVPAPSRGPTPRSGAFLFNNFKDPCLL